MLGAVPRTFARLPTSDQLDRRDIGVTGVLAIMESPGTD
jgi:hypothetical protein